MIPLVFWLVLITGSYQTTTTTVIPVPFATVEDCRIAGDQSQVRYSCIQQRRDDVSTFQRWGSDGTIRDYAR